MNNIIMIAPPAAGKGTLTKMFRDKYGYVSLSTGDILREQALEDSNLRELLKTGKLVSDELVFKTLKAKLNKLGNTPYILDGFPRTIKQAEMLSNMDLDIGVVIYLDIDKEELKNRILSRVVCPKCKRSYSSNEKMYMPKEEGICDKCFSKLIRREDDNEEIFEARYKEYLENTMPLIDYYREKGVLISTSKTDTLSIFEEVSSMVIKND